MILAAELMVLPATLSPLLPLELVQELEELIGHRLLHDFAVDCPQMPADGRLSCVVEPDRSTSNVPR